jgi:hypothetical protein
MTATIKSAPLDAVSLVSEYVAAWRAVNKMNDPPDITFAGGWFTFKAPRLPARKYRRHAVETMRDTLRERAAKGDGQP